MQEILLAIDMKASVFNIERVVLSEKLGKGSTSLTEKFHHYTHDIMSEKDNC